MMGKEITQLLNGIITEPNINEINLFKQSITKKYRQECTYFICEIPIYPPNHIRDDILRFYDQYSYLYPIQLQYLKSIMVI